MSLLFSKKGKKSDKESLPNQEDKKVVEEEKKEKVIKRIQKLIKIY